MDSTAPDLSELTEASTRACTIRVSGSGKTFSVPRSDLLLLSALAQGVDYPHNCRVGTCGSCKTRLLKGRISPMVDFALSPLTNEELQAGYILACQAKVRTDLEIEVEIGKQKNLPLRTIPARVTRWRKLPGQVLDLRLQLDEPLMFHAGQYATLAASGSFVRRSYSFYDIPPDPTGQGATEVGFLVKRLPGGRFSEWLFAEDRTGVKIWLEGPMGHMGFDEVERDGLCVAGGTGLAPILSIVADRIERSATAKFTIVFGVRTAADTFAEPMLEALMAKAPGRIRLVNILSHESTDSAWNGLRGLVTDALTPDLGVDFGNIAAFICGSLPMVEAVEHRLLQLGVDASRVHADKFLPSGF